MCPRESGVIFVRVAVGLYVHVSGFSWFSYLNFLSLMCLNRTGSRAPVFKTNMETTGKILRGKKYRLKATQQCACERKSTIEMY